MIFINFIQKHYLEISFFLYVNFTQILFTSGLIGGFLLIRVFKKECLGLFVSIGSLLGFLIYFFYFQIIIIPNHFNKERIKENFHYGCMTYYATTKYKPKNSKDFSYRDYFIINHSFTEVYIRGENLPITKQINDFNTLMNSNICYPVRYLQFNFLFYKKIEVYDLVENHD